MMLEAFKTKVLPLKNKLFRYANSILNDYDLSKDVVQETMIKTWEKRDDFHKIKNWGAWCMKVTRNYALDKKRMVLYPISKKIMKQHFFLNWEYINYWIEEIFKTST